MSIITPPVFTPVHEEETQYLRAIMEDTIRKMIQNNNFLLDLAPLGKIIFVNPNQLGGGQPPSDFWQICDGSEITNPNSPLRSIGLNLRFTPNLKDRYPCGSVDAVSNPTGGTHTHFLNHSHTTGTASADGGGLRKKGDRRRRNNHTHAIASQYPTEGTVIEAPAYVYYIAYMKII
jgi:hypothetical protein